MHNIYLWHMRKIIDLPKSYLYNLEKQAKEQKRSLKAHMEFVLMEQSAKGFKK